MAVIIPLNALTNPLQFNVLRRTVEKNMPQERGEAIGKKEGWDDCFLDLHGCRIIDYKIRIGKIGDGVVGGVFQLETFNGLHSTRFNYFLTELETNDLISFNDTDLTSSGHYYFGTYRRNDSNTIPTSIEAFDTKKIEASEPVNESTFNRDLEIDVEVLKEWIKKMSPDDLT